MSKFGWSYPAGCSGPPEDPPEKVCICGDFESDHDVNEADELGACLNENCDCEKFTAQPPEIEPLPDPAEYADLGMEPDRDDDGEL